MSKPPAIARALERIERDERKARANWIELQRSIVQKDAQTHLEVVAKQEAAHRAINAAIAIITGHHLIMGATQAKEQ